MPLLGLSLLAIVGLFLTQTLVIVPLDLIFALKVPLWLTVLGLFFLFAWLLGD